MQEVLGVKVEKVIVSYSTVHPLRTAFERSLRQLVVTIPSSSRSRWHVACWEAQRHQGVKLMYSDSFSENQVEWTVCTVNASFFFDRAVRTFNFGHFCFEFDAIVSLARMC